MAISNKDEYYTVFDPQNYLETYCQLDSENKQGLRFLVEVLHRFPKNELLILEFGGGPALYPVAAEAPYAREVHFCDYVPANLDEVRRWLDGDENAFDWQRHIEYVLKLEGNPTDFKAATQRATEMRQKVTRLMLCDACSATPLLGRETGPYDLVVARDCTDVAAANVSEWMQVMRNISVLVTPGGWLLVTVTTGASKDTFDDQTSFPCANLSREDVYNGYLAAGYDPDTFYFEEITLPASIEYSGAIFAIARKTS